ncbi:MAG: DSD1 family PLP-dependent enzyme [Pseudomonadota bacterium]
MTDIPRKLSHLQTPTLLVDPARLDRNVKRLRERAAKLKVKLRPHLKTGKSLDVARQVLDGGAGPATVSTLAEAEYFAAGGVTDILYAVGIAPQKLERVAKLRAKGCDLAVLLDSMDQAQAVADKSKETGDPIPAFIEIDSDGHRSGLAPDDPALIEIARCLHEGGAEMRGVLAHAGESYTVSGSEAHAEFAELERSMTVKAADNIRAAGIPCPEVSVGSTPTAHGAQSLEGVTELRAGVYSFFDLFMAGIGVCTLDDIAMTVLATVIGHQKDKGWIIVDAGWMAMSRDRGTAAQEIDQGYGLVADAGGEIYPDLIMSGANQEHGILSIRPGSTATLPDLAIGTQVRILPNHACATAAQYSGYNVLKPGSTELSAFWPRMNGW